MKQITNTVVMVEPSFFGYDTETAKTNAFQKNTRNEEHTRKRALNEFRSMVSLLRNHGITVLVLPSKLNTFGAVFPNNWFSHHQDEKLVIYPMLTQNRRLERQLVPLLQTLATVGINKPDNIDLTHDEQQGLILEGTGSLILDRVHQVAFALESPRTVKEEFEKWCMLMGYTGVFFHGFDTENRSIYHTNVVMSIGEEFILLCLDAIRDENEKEMVIKKITSLKKELISISLDQVFAFCGNLLQLRTKNGEKKIVMSETARNAFTKEQLARLEKHAEIISIAIPTIEEVGGGSVRCMLAEVFPPESV